MPTIRANGIDIYYEQRGSGPRLLYFQGSGQTLAKSGVMIDGFAKEFDVARPVNRALVDMIAGMQSAPASDEVRRGEVAQLDARSRLDVIDRLGSITCPTLVQAGRYDHIAPPANAEVIAQHIPNAQLRLYEGGHIFFLQDPQAVPDVMEFLATD